MSAFKTALANIGGFANQEFGTNFRIHDIAFTFVGIFNEHDRTETLEEGGFLEDVDAIIEVWKPEFAKTNPVTVPREGMRLQHGGKKYVIKGVSEDDVCYKLHLTGINK